MGTSHKTVEQWVAGLPLASKLATLFPRKVADVANLSSAQISDIVRIFAGDLEEILNENCTALQNALSVEAEIKGNAKFGTYLGNFGKIENFHESMYENMAPNPNWEPAMKAEHENNTDLFTTPNYNIETCPKDEWLAIVEGKSPPIASMGYGRMIRHLDEYLTSDVTREAGLTRPEVIAVVLYTGPMYLLWNAILRKYPTSMYDALKAKDSLFPTSIFVLMSALQKIARVMVLQSGQSLYRGVDGNMELPEAFSIPDTHGCVGVMERGFMSTTADLKVAISYSGVEMGKAHPKVFRIKAGSVDRGANISSLSQYPSEQEFLWLPHAFLEPTGEIETIVTPYGLVEIINVRANSNLKAMVLEDYESMRKDLHSNSFKFQLEDLQRLLEKVTSGCPM